MNLWNDTWLIDYCISGRMFKLGDVDNWAYTAEHEKMSMEYRKDNKQICTDGDVHRHCIHLRKQRHKIFGEAQKLEYFGESKRSYERVEKSIRAAIIGKLYYNHGIPLDQLSYTEPFERIFSSVQSKSTLKLSRHDVWRTMLYMRKRGELPTLKHRLVGETFGF